MFDWCEKVVRWIRLRNGTAKAIDALGVGPWDGETSARRLDSIPHWALAASELHSTCL